MNNNNNDITYSNTNNLINVNYNLNRLESENANNDNNDYEEEVNTTIASSNNNYERNNQINALQRNTDNSDAISQFTSFNTVVVNKDNFNMQNDKAPNLEKKESLISSGNLTQVNKIYPTKTNKDSSNNPEDHLKLSLQGENQNQNILSLTQITQSNDNEIREYMQMKNFEITRFDTAFCLSVDGSFHSETAFDIVTEDFLRKESDKLLIVHIFNSGLDETYNFRNRKDTIIDCYSTRILKMDKSRALFLQEDRISKVHALEQVNRISANYKCSYLVSGYYGIKGPKGDNKELSKGVDYLLSYSRSPTIIIKENTLRKNKLNRQIKWLFVFDRAYMNCYSILNRFLPLINNEKDHVFGFSMLPSYINFDDIKKNFLLDMELCRIRSFDYEAIEYKKTSSEFVREKVNFGDTLFDYVVFYNNPEKHHSEGNFSDIVNLVTKCASNICFVNGP